MKLLIYSFNSPCVKVRILGLSFSLTSWQFTVGLPSEQLFSLIVVFLAMLYLLPFLSSRIESKVYMQVSKHEFIDDFRWNFKIAFPNFLKLIRSRKVISITLECNKNYYRRQCASRLDSYILLLSFVEMVWVILWLLASQRMVLILRRVMLDLRDRW